MQFKGVVQCTVFSLKNQMWPLEFENGNLQTKNSYATEF